ncbi:hypothetical protein ACHAXA_007785 [Cyclostephanos tholiformis]|uniref:Uncharacterized protein n=1 Tax=Cyclostephanos tholiformis TaxID=382380 RepID=A0ABD3R9F4_9STRA
MMMEEGHSRRRRYDDGDFYGRAQDDHRGAAVTASVVDEHNDGYHYDDDDYDYHSEDGYDDDGGECNHDGYDYDYYYDYDREGHSYHSPRNGPRHYNYHHANGGTAQSLPSMRRIRDVHRHDDVINEDDEYRRRGLGHIRETTGEEYDDYYRQHRHRGGRGGGGRSIHGVVRESRSEGGRDRYNSFLRDDGPRGGGDFRYHDRRWEDPSVGGGGDPYYTVSPGGGPPSPPPSHRHHHHRRQYRYHSKRPDPSVGGESAISSPSRRPPPLTPRQPESTPEVMTMSTAVDLPFNSDHRDVVSTASASAITFGSRSYYSTGTTSHHSDSGNKKVATIPRRVNLPARPPPPPPKLSSPPPPLPDPSSHMSTRKLTMDHSLPELPYLPPEMNGRRRGDDPSVVSLPLAAPAPDVDSSHANDKIAIVRHNRPLRSIDAGKSRDMMIGRGKSVGSVSSRRRTRKKGEESRRRTRSRSLDRSIRSTTSRRRRLGENIEMSIPSSSSSIPSSRKKRSRNDDGGGGVRGGSSSIKSSTRTRTRSRSRSRSVDKSIALSSSSRSRYSGSAGGDKIRPYDEDRRSLISGHDSVVSRDSDGSWWRASTMSSLMASTRHDIDDDGYCRSHPDVRLMKLREDGRWRILRKRCPECIAVEDRPTSRNLHSDYYNNYDDDDDSNDRGKSYTESMTHSSALNDGNLSLDNSNTTSSSPSAFHDLGLTIQKTPEEMEAMEATNRLKRRLAARAYHFPGNTWWQDWMQYLSNTHTVLGLFFHHPLHPMKFQERLVILMGSIVGMSISNFTYMYYIKNGYSMTEVVFTFVVVDITRMMITLWTLGSFVHTMFDLLLWHMKACTICRYKGKIDENLMRWGRVAGLFVVVLATFAGVYAVLLRASIEYKGEGSTSEQAAESIRNNELYKIQFEDKRSFRFLLGYLVEFILALFVYYPIAVTILFSGVLGCGGRIPILGGRPREMKKEKRYEMNKRQPKILKAVNIEGNGSDSSLDYYANTYRGDSRFEDHSII